MYSTYENAGYAPAGMRGRADRPAARIMILGGGPNRIGQGIEFDYCCVHAVLPCEEAGYETIMVNCNPETVSTDYDTVGPALFRAADRRRRDRDRRARRWNGDASGVIVQFGGQTPLKLAPTLEAAGVPILGTSPDAIDLAEDRERFQVLLQDLELRSRETASHAAATKRCRSDEIGYPVLIRPSYVLGGRAMEIVHDKQG